MESNFLSVVRNSYFTRLIFCSILTNLVLFGEPMQEMVLSVTAKKTYKISALNASRYVSQKHEQQIMLPYATTPGMATLPEIEVFSLKQVNKTSSIFYAMEEQAVVGADPLSGVENPYDNFFTIQLPENVDLKNHEVVMAYDLYGISGAEQTTKRINNMPAYGGKMVKLTNQWIGVKEILPVGYLKTGTNEIFFNRRADEKYRYDVKNLRIELREKSTQDIVVSGAATVNNDSSLHLVASVSNPQVTEVEILGEVVPVHEGVLEKVFINVSKGINTLRLTYKKR